MSDSLSSADRDARIAAPVSEDRALVDAYGESVEQAMIASTRSGATYKKYAAARGRCRGELVSALCSRAREIEELRAELRAALSREEEAKKDAERVNWLEQAVASADHEGGRCVVVIGAWYSSDTPSPDGYSVNVGELHVDPNEWANLREAIDCARSVSLSENG